MHPPSPALPFPSLPNEPSNIGWELQKQSSSGLGLQIHVPKKRGFLTQTGGTHSFSPRWTCKEKETNSRDQGKVWVGRNLKNPRVSTLALMPIVNFINCLPVYGTQTWMQTQSKNLITSRNHFSLLKFKDTFYAKKVNIFQPRQIFVRL